MNIRQTDKERFLKLRKKLFDAIRKSLEEDGHCKSYEGTFEITECLPNYFEDEYGDKESYYVIKLHCYVVGPARHYEWKGFSFTEVLNQAEAEILCWIGEGGVDNG